MHPRESGVHPVHPSFFYPARSRSHRVLPCSADWITAQSARAWQNSTRSHACKVKSGGGARHAHLIRIQCMRARPISICFKLSCACSCHALQTGSQLTINVYCTAVMNLKSCLLVFDSRAHFLKAKQFYTSGFFMKMD